MFEFIKTYQNIIKIGVLSIISIILLLSLSAIFVYSSYLNKYKPISDSPIPLSNLPKTEEILNSPNIITSKPKNIDTPNIITSKSNNIDTPNKITSKSNNIDTPNIITSKSNNNLPKSILKKPNLPKTSSYIFIGCNDNNENNNVIY